MEKADSNRWAEHMCTLGTVVTLDQGQGDEEYTDFWAYLGEDGEIQPFQDNDDSVKEFAPLLFRVDGDSSKDLQKIAGRGHRGDTVGCDRCHGWGKFQSQIE